MRRRDIPNKLKSILDKYQIRKINKKCKLIEHSMKLKDENTSHYSIPYRRSPEYNNFIQEQIQKYLDEDIIRESDSNITSPVVLVKKVRKDSLLY